MHKNENPELHDQVMNYGRGQSDYGRLILSLFVAACSAEQIASVLDDLRPRDGLGFEAKTPNGRPLRQFIGKTPAQIEAEAGEHAPTILEMLARAGFSGNKATPAGAGESVDTPPVVPAGPDEEFAGFPASMLWALPVAELEAMADLSPGDIARIRAGGRAAESGKA